MGYFGPTDLIPLYTETFPAIISMFSNWFNQKQYRIKCPDGSIKIVYKNVDEAFPLQIHEVTRNISSDIQALEEVKASVKVEHTNHIQGLLYQIDELNRGVMMHFRAAYLVFTSDPCSQNKYLADQVQTIITEQGRLQNLYVRIKAMITLVQTNPEQSERILNMFLALADEIGGRPAIEAAKIEIEQNRRIAEQWAKQQIPNSSKDTQSNANES